MKIHLTQESGVQILSVTDAVVDQNVQVLKAGVTKLLKNGHNRIILELLNPKEVVPSALEGISLFHPLARQLAGDLVVVFPSALKPKELKLECYPDRASALAHFNSKTGEKGAGGSTELLNLVEKQKAMIEEFRKQLQASGGDALGRELAALKEENKTLKLRLEELIVAFRTPQSNTAYNEKITLLENEIMRLEERLSRAP